MALAPSRAGSPARTNRTTQGRDRDRRQRSRRPTSRAAKPRRVAQRRDRRRRTNTNDASRTSTVTTSSTRSRMIVANAPVAVIALAARLACAQKIRANDLARARRQHAARREPDGRRAERARRTSCRPSGSSRYCQRSARIARFTTSSPATSASHSGRARTISRANAPEIHVVEKQRHSATRERPARRWCECAIACGSNVLYYSALRLPTSRGHYMLLLSAPVAPCKMHSLLRTRILLPLAAPILQTTLADRRPDRQGKVRDIYEFGDRLLIVATDRISAFDYVLGSGIPDKGKVLTQISAFWFERTRSIVAEPRARRPIAATTRPERAARGDAAARPLDARHANRAAADRVRRARLSVGLGLEGLRRRPARCAASACRPDCANRIACRSRSSRPATKAQSGHDINISEKDAAALVGPPVLDRSAI